jgi:periplasmic divalent cation tolerance protein
MTDDICEVIITAPDQEWLVSFTRQLIADRLAASGHHTPIRSVYTWQGQIEDTTETRAAIRTRVSHVQAIIDRVNAQHPYDVPSVTAIPIIAANPSYRAWILAATRDEP